MNLASLAMEDFRRANNFSAEGGANGLMAEAYTENREFSGKAANQVDANSGVLRRARSG